MLKDEIHSFTRLQALRHPSLRLSGWQDAEHYLLFRSQEYDYRDLADRVAEKRVLDWGCNNGYGAAILAKSAAVTGVDVSELLVQEARRRFSDLPFHVIDGQRTPFPSGSFDVIVLFQVLEHLPEPVVVLEEIKRLLSPGGTLVVTTPNATARLDGGAPWNPFHVTEYSASSGLQLLGAVFEVDKVEGLRAVPSVEEIEHARWRKRRLARKVELSIRPLIDEIRRAHSTDDYDVLAELHITLRATGNDRLPSIKEIEQLEGLGDIFHYTSENLESALSLRFTCRAP